MVEFIRDFLQKIKAYQDWRPCGEWFHCGSWLAAALCSCWCPRWWQSHLYSQTPAESPPDLGRRCSPACGCWVGDHEDGKTCLTDHVWSFEAFDIQHFKVTRSSVSLLVVCLPSRTKKKRVFMFASLKSQRSQTSASPLTPESCSSSASNSNWDLLWPEELAEGHCQTCEIKKCHPLVNIHQRPSERSVATRTSTLTLTVESQEAVYRRSSNQHIALTASSWPIRVSCRLPYGTE